MVVGWILTGFDFCHSCSGLPQGVLLVVQPLFEEIVKEDSLDNRMN